MSYVSRYRFLCEQAKGKKVLHLGCVGDRLIPRREQTLHEALSEYAAELWGVDLNESGIAALSRKLPALSKRLLVGDVCRLLDLGTELPRDFEIILAGDLIEHLTDPAELFKICRGLLTKGGVLLLTTPNALGLLNVLRAWRGIEYTSPVHTCFFSFATLDEMARRAGWVISRYWTCYDNEGYAAWKKFLGARFFNVFPQWGGTLIAAAAPQNDAREAGR